MTATIERLKGLQTEIKSELTKAQSELTRLESEHATADTAARKAATEYEDLQQVLRPLTHPRAGRARQSLADPLAQFVADCKRQHGVAQGERVRTHGQLQAAKSRVAELERALTQLDGLLTPAEQEAAA